jgi:hypothetical protein
VLPSHIVYVPWAFATSTLRQAVSACRRTTSSVHRGSILRERPIGSIHRECVDHVVALGEQHLRQVLKSHASYYNASRTHRALAKDAPVSRAFQRIGRTVSHALVGGTASSIRPNRSFQLAVSVAQMYTLRMDTSDSLKVRVERRGENTFGSFAATAGFSL